MQIKSKIKRAFATAILISFIPEIIVAAIATALTEKNLAEFFFILLGLYGVYFLIWLKNSLWEWLLFYLKDRKETKEFYLDHFKKNKYPEPDEYINTGSDWILEISEDKRNDVDLRVAAAAISGLLSGMRLLGHTQRFLRVSFSIEDAIEEYKKTFPKKENAPSENLSKGGFSKEDDEKYAKLVQLVQFKCKAANICIEEIKDFSRSDAGDLKKAQLEKTKEQLEGVVKTCLEHAQEIQGDFYRSAALHQIADLLSKAGQYDRASKIIELIIVDFIQEQAKALLAEEKNKNISKL